MKKMKQTDIRELESDIKNLKLPSVQMPAHQRKLKKILMDSGYLRRETPNHPARQKINGGIGMKPKIFVLAASIALMVLTFGAYMMFFAVPQVAASLTLQVNPAVSLTLSDRNTVVGAEGLDEQGRALLAGLNLEGKEVQEALRIIAGVLHEADLLTAERRIFVAIKPVGDRLGKVDLETLAKTVEEALDGYLTEHDLQVEVVSAAITAEFAGVVKELNLYPENYVDLVAKFGSATAMRIFDMQNELGLDPALFKEELDTMAASLIDMVEAGITVENALSILKSSLATDSTFEELTTITAALIDLHEVGAPQEDITAIVKLLEEQITAGAVERNLVLEEFTTIVAAQIDMLDAGIPASEALAVLKTAMMADPKLEELTTVTAAMIDLVDEGLSKQEALLRIQRAIKADPTLDSFDDLLETPETTNAEDTDEPADDEGNATKPNGNGNDTEVEPEVESEVEPEVESEVEPEVEPIDDGDEKKDEAAVPDETQKDKELDVKEGVEAVNRSDDVKEDTDEAAVPDETQKDKELDVKEGVEAVNRSDDVKEDTDEAADTDRSKPDANQKPDEKTNEE